jgi:hypothetical protein
MILKRLVAYGDADRAGVDRRRYAGVEVDFKFAVNWGERILTGTMNSPTKLASAKEEIHKGSRRTADRDPLILISMGVQIGPANVRSVDQTRQVAHPHARKPPHRNVPARWRLHFASEHICFAFRIPSEGSAAGQGSMRGFFTNYGQAVSFEAAASPH